MLTPLPHKEKNNKILPLEPFSGRLQGMEKAKTEPIVKWLRMVDKPLVVKEGDKKGAEPEDKQKR